MLHQQAVPRHTLDLLREISPGLARDGFYLAGGTALALRLGHRVSVDLDFFHQDEFDPEKQAGNLSELTGESPAILQKSAGSICLILRETKVELLQYCYPMISPVERHGEFSLCSLADNVAMQLSALVARGSKKDFVDMASILETNSLGQILEWFGMKFPEAEPFMAIKSLTWFEDAKDEPDPIFLKGQSWNDVKSEVIEATRQFLGV